MTGPRRKSACACAFAMYGGNRGGAVQGAQACCWGLWPGLFLPWCHEIAVFRGARLCELVSLCICDVSRCDGKGAVRDLLCAAYGVPMGLIGSSACTSTGKAAALLVLWLLCSG